MISTYKSQGYITFKRPSVFWSFWSFWSFGLLKDLKSHKKRPRTFTDVPTQPTAHIYGSVSAGRTKAYCIQCWDSLKRELMRSDQAQLENGTIEAVRSEDTLNNIR